VAPRQEVAQWWKAVWVMRAGTEETPMSKQDNDAVRGPASDGRRAVSSMAAEIDEETEVQRRNTPAAGSWINSAAQSAPQTPTWHHRTEGVPGAARRHCGSSTSPTGCKMQVNHRAPDARTPRCPVAE